MSWTKKQLIEQAFEEIGFASYTFDLDPERIQSAMRRMDAMLAMWNTQNIRIGYPLHADPTSSLLTESVNVPDTAIEAIYTNLAVRLCPSLGKIPSNELKASANQSYKTLLLANVRRDEMQFPETLPSGAGNKPWRYQGEFMDDPEDHLTAQGLQSNDLLES